MEIEIKKTDATVNGPISAFPSFTAKDFVKFNKGRKSNYPNAEYMVGGTKVKTTFNLTEFAAQNPSLMVEKDAETFVVTLPDQAFAEEGDRCPRPVL